MFSLGHCLEWHVVCGLQGASYRGTLASSVSGFKCRAWGSVLPGTTELPSNFYHAFGLNENYCRNPGVKQLKRMSVWCFTLGGPVWEYCAVPHCDELPGQPHGRVKPSSWMIAGTLPLATCCVRPVHCALCHGAGGPICAAAGGHPIRTRQSSPAAPCPPQRRTLVTRSARVEVTEARCTCKATRMSARPMMS